MSGAPVLWLTGLSGTGKTTIAWALAEQLCRYRKHFAILDGDELRQTICAGLGFSKADRDENVSRIGHAAFMYAAQGKWAIVAAISPYRAARDEIRGDCEERGIPFIEIQLHCPMSVLELRDPKGLYKRARTGELQNFTGVSDPYEAALTPDVAVWTNNRIPDGVDAIIHALVDRGLL